MKKLAFCKILMLVFLVALMAGACSKSKFPGFKKTKTGLYYKIHVAHKDSLKPQIGDILIAELTVRYIGDSAKSTTLFTNAGKPDKIFRVDTSLYKGDLNEGLAMLHVGDSATFMLLVDSLRKYVSLPETIKNGEYLYYDIKLHKIQNKADFEKEQQALMQQQMAAIAQAKAQEEVDLKKYLDANKIKVQPTENGLYFIEIKKGKGAKAENGKKVKVHYTGKFLNGNKFDSSVDRGQPIEFQLGSGQVIKGWEEGLTMMKAGGKAKFIIPSKLAYGDAGVGPIPPCSPLVFEVELVEVQ